MKSVLFRNLVLLIIVMRLSEKATKETIEPSFYPHLMYKREWRVK